MIKFISRLFSVLIILIIFSGCSDPGVQRTNFISDKDLESGNISVEFNQALVMYASGDVEASVDGGWQAVEVGDFVIESQSLRIGESSFCELQFGERAVVRIEENTKLELSSLFLKPDESDIKLDVEVGTVLCKVNKLSESEQFKVKTRTAVCGVRGTEFGVSVNSTHETTLAVREGKVAILPSSVDVDSLREQAAETGEAILKIIDDLEASAPVVGADQEVVLTEQTSKDTEAVFIQVEKEIKNIAGKEKAAVTKQDRDDLIKSINSTNARVQTNVDKPKIISAARKANLDKIEAIQMRKIPVVSKEDKIKDNAVPERSAPALIRVGIIAFPKDASIFLGNHFLGLGKFQGLYTSGENLKFRVEKKGFVPQTLFIEVNTTGKRFYEVKLEEIETKAAAQDPKNPDQNRPIDKDKILDKEQVIDRDKVIDRDRVIDREKDVRPAENDRAVSAVIDKDNPKARIEKIVNAVQHSNSKFIGEIVHGVTALYAADFNGIVYAFDISGRLLWKVQTNNAPNINSSPVVMGDRVYFSGQRELTIIDGAAGKILKQMPLDLTSNHMFGQRIVDAGNVALLPTDKSIKVISKSDGALVREHPIPGSSRMTPTWYNGNIYIVNSLGSVQGIEIASGKMIGKPIVTSASDPIAISISLYGSRGYFVGRKNKLICVDLELNRVMWEQQLVENDYPHQDLIASREGVYMLAGATVFGFDHTGKPLFPPIKEVTAAPGYGAGRLFVAKNDGSLLILNAADGKLITSVKLDSKISARPLLWREQIFAATESGKLAVISNK